MAIKFNLAKPQLFNNAAKACYDRAIPSLGLMATEHFGILSSAATCMLAIIFAMPFLVRMVYGVSPHLLCHQWQSSNSGGLARKWSVSLHMDVC
jgi:hypothetical protein